MSDKNKPVKKQAKARGLGRGLSALMADVSVPTEPEIETKSAPAPPQHRALNPVSQRTALLRRRQR